MDSIAIHGSDDRYFEEVIPSDAEVNLHPYNGEPFSHYWIVSKNEKSLKVSFGCGGYYPEIAKQRIEEFFSQL